MYSNSGSTDRLDHPLQQGEGRSESERVSGRGRMNESGRREEKRRGEKRRGLVYSYCLFLQMRTHVHTHTHMHAHRQEGVALKVCGDRKETTVQSSTRYWSKTVVMMKTLSVKLLLYGAYGPLCRKKLCKRCVCFVVGVRLRGCWERLCGCVSECEIFNPRPFFLGSYALHLLRTYAHVLPHRQMKRTTKLAAPCASKK